MFAASQSLNHRRRRYLAKGLPRAPNVFLTSLSGMLGHFKLVFFFFFFNEAGGGGGKVTIQAKSSPQLNQDIFSSADKCMKNLIKCK